MDAEPQNNLAVIYYVAVVCLLYIFLMMATCISGL